MTGSLITSDGDLALRAAFDGVGVARLPGSSVESLIAERGLVPLLQDWMPRSVGFFLYYPSRRQMPVALQAFVDFLKKETRREARGSARAVALPEDDDGNIDPEENRDRV